MLDEEVIVKGSKHSGERLLIVNVIMMVMVPALIFGGNSELARGLFIALGIVAPLNVINYKRIWIDAPAGTLFFYTLALLPYLASFAIALMGEPVLVSSDDAAKGFWRLAAENPSQILSATDSMLSAITPELLTLSAAACGLSIFFITDSRYIIRRIFFFISLGAAALAVLGFAYDALNTIPRFILPSFGENSFATFTDAIQWSAFAMLWMGAALVIGAYTSQRFRLFTFLYSLKFFAIAISFILLASILYCGTPLEKTVSLFLASAGFAIIFIDTIPTKGNLARHWTSRYVHTKYRKLHLSIPALAYGTISLILLSASISTGMNSWNNPNERLISSNDKFSISINDRMAIFEDCKELVKKCPPCGWGSSSFPTVFAFYQGADLSDSPYPSPHSDLLQKLIENGIVGLTLSFLTPFAFFLRWLWKRDFSKSGALLFMTAASLLVIGVFDYPFQSVAVLMSFWVIMMSAFRWDSCEVR